MTNPTASVDVQQPSAHSCRWYVVDRQTQTAKLCCEHALGHDTDRVNADESRLLHFSAAGAGSACEVRVTLRLSKVTYVSSSYAQAEPRCA